MPIAPHRRAVPAEAHPAARARPAGLAAAEAFRRSHEGVDLDDSLNWPLMVPTARGVRAVTPANGRTKIALDVASRRALVAPAVFVAGDEPPLLRVAGPQRIGPTGAIWHDIQRPDASGRGGSTHAVSPKGDRREYDADTETETVTHADGSYDSYDKDGTHFHRDKDESYIEDKSGRRTDTFKNNKDGTVTSAEQKTQTDKDGNEWITNDKGETIGGRIADAASDAYKNPNSKKSPPPGDKKASGAGEPHYLTRDGVEFTTQKVGEFVLVTGVPGREIQVRQSPWNDAPDVSAITAFAVRVGNSVIEVRQDGTALVDGEAAPVGVAKQGDLPGGGAVGLWRDGDRLSHAVLLWPDLSAMWIARNGSYMDFTLQWSGPAPEHRGLLGSNDGKPENDLADRRGRIADPTQQNEVDAFVHSWRVGDEESLFTYAPGQSTASFTDTGFPRAQAVARHDALAREKCADIPDSFAKRNCLYDVGVTGEAQFADSHKDVARRAGVLAATGQTAARGASPINARPSSVRLSHAERGVAVEVSETADISETLGAGASKVFRFAFTQEQLTVLSEHLDIKTAIAPGKASYALFDAQGVNVIPPTAAVNDSSRVRLAKGTYFLQIVGPGSIKLRLF